MKYGIAPELEFYDEDCAIRELQYYLDGNDNSQNYDMINYERLFYIEDNFYIFPTIAISYTNKYFEIMFHWLKFEYYEATCLEFENDKENEFSSL